MVNKIYGIIFITLIYSLIFVLLLVCCYYCNKSRSIDFQNNDLFICNRVNIRNIIVEDVGIDEECCICLEKLDNNLYKMRCCNKYLHNKCLSNHIVYKHTNGLEITCPLCREII